MLNRLRRTSSIAGLAIALFIFWFIACPSSGRRVGTAAKKEAAGTEGKAGDAGRGPVEGARDPAESSKPASTASAREYCRDLLSRALLKRTLRPGFSAWSLGHFHRSNAAFREVADSFCKEAGDELVPVCKEILADCGSEASSSLVAAILGHSRRADAFDLLKELSVRGQGPPESKELFSSAVYSIGMIRSPQSAAFLLKLFAEIPGAHVSIAEKFGTPLMAAIGMCGKEGVAALRESALLELTSDRQPDQDEGLRAFRWSHLGLVSSPEAVTELKAIAEGDSDIRLRGMAIAAMGHSPDSAQRAYLAELYARESDPLIRRGVLEALLDGISEASLEWPAMRDRMAAPLASILKATRLPSGDDYIDYATIHLACSAGTPESAKYVDDWIRAASKGSYAASEIEWIDIAVSALASQGASPERIDALLEGKGVASSDRMFYLASLQNQSPIPIGGKKLAREFIDFLDKSPEREINGNFLNCLQALARIPDAQDEAAGCIDRMIERAEGTWRLTYIDAAQSAGEACLRPFEKVIRNAGELPEVLHASQGYLLTLPDGATLDSELGDRMRSLFSSRALGVFHAGALKQSSAVFARTVGLYFGRFGTPQDLAWLESLPRTMNDIRNVREDHLATFREELAWECARAADAIKLRAK